MKSKLVVLLFAVSTCCLAQGQLQKGTVLIGATTNLIGNLNTLGLGGAANNAGIQFGKSKYKYEAGQFSSESETSVTAINLNPTVGIMATNNVMIGLSAGLFIFKAKEDDDEETLTATSASPFVRAYFKNEGKTLPYLEARGGISSIKYGDDDEDAETTPFFGAKFGGAIFLSPKVSLDLFVDYIYSKDKEENDNSTSTSTQSLFGFGLGFSVFL